MLWPMKKNQNKFFLSLAAVMMTAAIAGCYQTVNTRGQVIYPSQLRQITVGQSTKQDVMMLLGTPSTTGTKNDNRWYYITTTMTDKPLKTNIVDDRTVLVLDFDPSSSIVTAMDTKTANDGKAIEPDGGQTSTYGQKMGLLDHVFNSVGFGKK